MKTRSVFVTGTDTGIGKTRVSVALLRALVESGVNAVGMKPIASGCERTRDGLRNDDALALLAAGYAPILYDDINPYALPEPISPHAAALRGGTTITLEPIEAAYQRLREQSDCVVVEGVGGWAVPLSDTLMQAAIPQRLKIPVILVVGLRLGCINHALLTARAIIDDGCELLGWIGNRIDPDMLAVDQSITIVERLIPAPRLALLGHDENDRRESAAVESVLRAMPVRAA